MKKIFFTVLFFSSSFMAFAQSNVIGKSGSVGVGTLNPASIFHVFGGNATLWGITLGYCTGNAIITTDDGSKPISLQVAGCEIMRINNNGNVGINTTNPVSKLNLIGGGFTLGAYAVAVNYDVAFSIGDSHSSYMPTNSTWSTAGEVQ